MPRCHGGGELDVGIKVWRSKAMKALVDEDSKAKVDTITNR